MKIKVANFRRISYADITVNKVTLVGGKNEAGKTSIAESVAAVLTGEPISYNGGLSKRELKNILHKGAKESQIQVESHNEDGGFESLSYPSLVKTSSGMGLRASRIGTGLDKILTMTEKSRQAYFSEFFNAMPTKEQLETKIRVLNTGQILDFNELWNNIQGLGWDTVWNSYKTDGAKLKGKWEYITGEKYGCNKAEQWQPENWEIDLLKANEEDLKKEVETAKEWVEAALKSEAVSEAEIEELTKTADTEDKLDAELKTKIKELKELKAKQKILKDKSIDYIAADTQACPYCKQALQVISGKIETAVGLNEQQLTKLKAQKQANDSEIDELATLIVASEQLINNLRQDYEKAILATKKLNDLTSQKPTDKISSEDAKQRLKIAENRLKAFQDKSEVYNIHTDITNHVTIVDILSPGGLRKDVLKEALTNANKSLAESNFTGKEMLLNEDMTITYGEYHERFCSSSARFRINTVFQFMIAKRDESNIIVVDNADILDKEGRNGLMRLANKTNIPVLILMTINKKEQMPDMSKIGGLGYWIEDGVAGDCKGEDIV